MTAARMPNPDVANITAPAPLRDLPAWLVWKFEPPPGGGKPRKVPHYANGGRRRGVQGSPEDRRQLVTFELARAAAARRGFDGVGFATLDTWGVCAVDFDGCIRDGEVLPDVLAACEGTYAELSPSGQGVRAFVRGAFGNNKDNDTAQPFGVEVFSTAGFVTVTGRALPLVDMLDLRDAVSEPSPALRALCAGRFGGLADSASATGDTPPIGLSEYQIREALDVLPKDLHYDDWLRVGMAIHHETSGDGFHIWDEWSATSHKYTDTAYCKQRWDSFGRGGQRPVTAHALVKLANEHGAHIDLNANAADDFDVLPAEPAGAPEALRFRVMTTDEFLQRPRPTWIVKGLVPKADVMMLFGEPGAGKSFVALDIFGAVARGVPWRGLKTQQMRVVFIAAEGVGGFRNRVEAYELHHQAKAGVGVIDGAPNLLLPKDADDVAKGIKASFGGADIVVIDTLAQTTPGANENAAEDMGKALANCRRIGRALGGALVVLIHHAGKDTSKGARGWSGLKGAADTELEVARTPGGRAMRASKQKDGKDGQVWGFDLTEVLLAVDEDGDPISSCIVAEAPVPAGGASRLAPARKLGKWEQHVLAAIQEIAVAQTAGIEVSAVLDLAVMKEPKPEGKDTRRQHAKRALGNLIDEPDSAYFMDEDGKTFSIG